MKKSELKGTFNAVATYETERDVLGIKLYAENADRLEKAIKEEVEKQGCTDFERKDNVLYFGNQTFMLPRMRKQRAGTLTIRSKDYVFKEEGREPSYGALPKAENMLENGFMIETPQGVVTYTLSK